MRTKDNKNNGPLRVNSGPGCTGSANSTDITGSDASPIIDSKVEQVDGKGSRQGGKGTVWWKGWPSILFLIAILLVFVGDLNDFDFFEKEESTSDDKRLAVINKKKEIVSLNIDSLMSLSRRRSELFDEYELNSRSLAVAQEKGFDSSKVFSAAAAKNKADIKKYNGQIARVLMSIHEVYLEYPDLVVQQFNNVRYEGGREYKAALAFALEVVKSAPSGNRLEKYIKNAVENEM